MKKLIWIIVVLLSWQIFVYSEEQSIPSDFEVTLQRTLCFGPCPVYTLMIYGDGRVEYDGIEFVNVFGHQKKTISPDKVRKLFEEFNRIDFPALAEKISVFTASSCGSSTTDVPSTEISLKLNGKNLTMKHGNECYEDPIFKPLDEMANMIDTVVEVKDWISPSRFSGDLKEP